MNKGEKTKFDHEVDKTIENATRLGIGFAIVSKDALEGLIKKASKKSAISEKEARQAVSELIIESKIRERQLKKKVANAIKGVKTKVPVVTKKDAEKMKAEIVRLKKLLKKKKK